MKVLMKQEVRKVGKKGQIVEVSDGYGANFLIPNGYAVLYTEAAQKDYERELAKQALIDAQKRQEATELAAKLAGITLQFEASAGRRGEMIGTVSNKEIIKTLKEKYDIIINKNMIVEKNVIVNGFGKTSLKVELFKGVFGAINLNVELKEKK
ncbi:MAG: 50S ribosomal protein L9 [Bacilli bacterium]